MEDDMLDREIHDSTGTISRQDEMNRRSSLPLLIFDRPSSHHPQLEDGVIGFVAILSMLVTDKSREEKGL